MSYQSQSPSWEQTELQPLVAANDSGTTSTTTPSISFGGVANEEDESRNQNFRPATAPTMKQRRTSLLCSLLIYGLKNSTILITKLPRVRRLALIESIHHNLLHNHNDGADEEVLDMILYNIYTSPYLSEEDFQNTMKSSLWLGPSSVIPTEIVHDVLQTIIDSNWDALCAITRNHDMTHTTTFNPTQEPPNEEERLYEFRDMVVSILQTSKRLTNMEKRRRRRLGRNIHSSKSIEEIVHVAIVFLDTSKLFTDDSQRRQIKDLVASGRFDLLLQSEYFDCEEQKRIRRSDYITPKIDEEEGLVAVQEEEYCVICFEDITTTAATTILEQCGHEFCTECIENWLRRNSSCPTCRGQVRTSQEQVLTDVTSPLATVFSPGNGTFTSIFNPFISN